MTPLLYLVRHADAVDSIDDASRRLSPRGHKQVRHLAECLAKNDAFRPSRVWHSPLVRARETAELLMSELKLKPAWDERAELKSEADPEEIATLLREVKAPLALFGHEPHMSALASLLVTGRTSPVVFTFKKATILALDPAGHRWCVRWQLSPDLFE